MADRSAELTLAYQERLSELSRMAELLSGLVANSLEGMDHRHVDRITFRVKASGSFVAKALADPPYAQPLEEIEDQIGGRVIVFYTHDVELVRDALLELFTRVEQAFRRPASDDAFGYESHHMICVIPDHLKTEDWRVVSHMPNTFELQIRTLFMHAYAEPQHDLSYKTVSDLGPTQRREVAWIAASSWGADQALERLWRSMPSGETPEKLDD